MLEKFLEFIRNEKLFSPRDRILLAVSGGMDSALMAWLFHKCGFSFGIAHCNFGLRGMESDGDEYFVKEIAAKYEAPFYCRQFETAEYAHTKGISIQMAARELRYDFFNELLRNYEFKYIATAHHRDDEAETFFINLLRGTGIAGLSGYEPAQGKIIRPMLFAGRTEIEECIKKNMIRYREDSSNKSDKYIRNKIRNQLLPLLKEINPNVENTIRTDISRIKNIEKIYAQLIEEKRKEIVKVNKGVAKINIGKLSALKPVEAYLFGFLHPYGFSGDIIKSICGSAGKQPGKIFYSATHRLVKDRNYFLVSPKDESSERNEYQVMPGDLQITEPLKMSFSTIGFTGTVEIPDDKHLAFFDLEKLIFPLTIRRWQQGDHFYPYGMKGKKKLSDFFTDRKLSLIDKENIWLLCSGKDIIWIIGHRNDNRYKVTRNTKKIFIAELSKI